MKSSKNLLNNFLSISMSLLLLLGLIVPFSVNAENTDTSIDIRIVHTNDIHARVEENSKSGIIGIERLGGIINSYTANADMDLVLDSGDTFHGQSIATVVQGESIARLLKACGYDAMTAGNHDWSYGKDRLKELAQMSNLKMLAGNVVDNNGNKFFNDEFYIEEVNKNGMTIRVGVFGVIDPEMYSKTTPSNVEGLKFTEPVAYASKATDELKSHGCDVVIALSHTYNPTELAKQVNGVNLWLCGHEHINVDTTVQTPDGSTTYISESGYYLYDVGLIDLKFTFDNKGNVSLSYNKTLVDYEKSTSYPKDQNVTAVLNQIEAENAQVLNQVVGKSPVDLDGVWEHLRIDQTNLGSVVADSYLLATGADVAFENAGGIRASIKAGDVTYGDIIGVSPYGNYIVTKQINGKQLKEIIETSIDIQLRCIEANKITDQDTWPSDSGSYLQIGGITVEYNPTLSKNDRVISIKVGNDNLDENKIYTVATNNYNATSSDFPQLANAKEVGEFSACDEALTKYFKQDSSVILNSANSKRMIVTDKTHTDVTEPSTSTTTTVTTTTTTNTTNSTTMATSTTDATTSTEPTEAVTSTTAPTQNNGDNNSTQNPQGDEKSPQTGDDSVALFSLLLFAGVFATISLTVYKRKIKK